MTDPRKLPDDAAALAEQVPPLRERLPDYVRLFAMGAAPIVVVGGLVGLFTKHSVPRSIGYCAVGVGAVMLLIGGASGGQFANLGFGVLGRMTQGRRSDSAGDEKIVGPSGRSSRKFNVEYEDEKRLDPLERLRRGLRPEANPTAFWTVIGGALYIACGSLLVLA